MIIESIDNSFSRELQFLLDCLRNQDQPQEQFDSLFRFPLNWDVVLALAQRHRVMPLLYKRLQVLDENLLPTQISALRAAYIFNARRNLQLAKAALQVSRLFDQCGITSLLIKGPATAVLAYADLSLRHFVDIDLLIHPQDFFQSHQVLVTNNWQPALSLNHKQQNWLLRGDKDLTYHKHGLTLELHWCIAERGIAYPVPHKQLWDQVQAFQLLDHRLFTLSPENTLLYLALHASKHRWSSIQQILDFAASLRSSSTIDWAKMARLSRKYGLRRCLGLGLLLAEQLIGVTVPAGEAQALKNYSHVHRLAADVRRALVSQDLCVSAFILFYLQARERLQDKAYYLLDQFLVPKQEDWLNFPLPGILYPSYYLYRPLRLIQKLGFSTLRDYALGALQSRLA